jgi:hypothetical protein
VTLWPASHRRGLAAGLSVALVMAARGSGVWAADDQVGDVPDAAPPAETVRFAPAGNVQVMGLVRPADYDLGLMFDQQVFGRSRATQAVVVNNGVVINNGVIVNNGVVVNRAPPNADDSVLGKLTDLRRRGEARVARLEQVCGLSPEQRKLLDLALASDLRRVAGGIEAVRWKYLGQRIARQRLPVEQERLQAMQQDAIRCRGLIDRAFHHDSLVSVVEVGVLESDQRRRLADWITGRRATRWEAMVRLGLGQLDETVLGLSRRQHQSLVELLLADVPPLAVFEDERQARDPTSLYGMLVLARLGRAGERVVRPLLDPRQWAELQRRTVQAGQPEAVERMLVEQGILDVVNTSAGEEVP